MHTIWRHRASVWLCLSGGQHCHLDNTCQISEWQDSGTPLKGYLDQVRWAKKTHLNHTRHLFRVWGPGEDKEEKDERQQSVLSTWLQCGRLASSIHVTIPSLPQGPHPPSNCEPKILSVSHGFCQGISLQRHRHNQYIQSIEKFAQIITAGERCSSP